MLGGIICSGNTTAWAATRNVFGASMAAAVLYLFGLHDLWRRSGFLHCLEVMGADFDVSNQTDLSTGN